MYHSTNNLLQFDIFSQFLLTAVKLYTYINFSFLALLGKKIYKSLSSWKCETAAIFYSLTDYLHPS